ncbi:37S ribosomal protein S24, mitochondrial [Ophidiomyces ophidiicola]|nr:37S ribosomal protein S24, mitochondrial [Ophidiomyces ophidiicola]KAI1988567.1 37S ribosomal protein S24, mitochondrial [Ophidiomyces ophidiicola]KAI1989610.1 37S ribosomal protein S24, mitochondrial [Ophidiomyces ophidiicola]
MATAARSLSRTALSVLRQTTSKQKVRCPCPIARIPRRPFSATPFFSHDKHNGALDTLPTSAGLADDDDEASLEEWKISMGLEEAAATLDLQALRDLKAGLDALDNEDDDDDLDDLDDLDDDDEVDKPFEELPEKTGFWAEDENDSFAQYEDDDDWKDDDITSMAHAELQEHRDIRKYARIAAWDMPSLAALAKPFSLPPQTHLLRFRYTTYLGESHPAESKVVVELSSKDLSPTYLTEDQRITFLKLVGTRYNPGTDVVRMSCEKFATSAQNKRYLGDLVQKLITEAKEGDSFADVPLDLRHYKPKQKVAYPKSWDMTEDRRKQLEVAREKERLEQGNSNCVDGNATVWMASNHLPELRGGTARNPTPPYQWKERVKVKVPRRRILQRGTRFSR